jgi:hypothetical protein
VPLSLQELLLRGLYASAFGAVCHVPKPIGGHEIAEASRAISSVLLIGEETVVPIDAGDISSDALDYEYPLMASGRVTFGARPAKDLPIGEWEY